MSFMSRVSEFAIGVGVDINTLFKRVGPFARSTATVNYLASVMVDGEVQLIGDELYMKRASAVGALSCTNDLGVNGFIPAANVTPYHWGAKIGAQHNVTSQLQLALNYAGTLSEYHYTAATPTQAQLNTANATTVYLRSGTHVVSDTLAMRNAGVKVLGAGIENCIIKMTANKALWDIKHIDQYNSGNLMNVGLSDMTLMGAYTNPSSGSCAIKVGIVKHSYFTNIRVGGFFDDILLEGTQEPCMIENCNFFSGNAVTGNTGDAGGTFITLTVAEVAANSPNRTASLSDPNDPSKNYAHCVMVFVNNCEMRNGLDAKRYAFKIRATDGLYVNGGHFLNVTQDFILVDQFAANTPCANVKFDGTFFDGEAFATERVIHVIEPTFAHVAGVFTISLDFNNCKMNGCGDGESSARLVYCNSPYLSRLSINGGYMDKCSGSWWVQLRDGGDTAIIKNVEFKSTATYVPTGFILLGTPTAGAAFDKTIISGNQFISETGNRPTSIVRGVTDIGIVAILGNVFDNTSGTALNDTSTVGTWQTSGNIQI